MLRVTQELSQALAAGSTVIAEAIALVPILADAAYAWYSKRRGRRMGSVASVLGGLRQASSQLVAVD